MKILPNGFFSIEYTAEELARGLRLTAKAPRNNKFLTTCTGAVGLNGVLRTLDALGITEQYLTEAIPQGDFPYPQLFVLERHIIIANRTSIYEWDGNTMALGIGSLTEGHRWSIAPSHNFIYMSNGAVSVVRDPLAQTWAIDSNAPKGAVCMFNGQILVGNPS